LRLKITLDHINEKEANKRKWFFVHYMTRFGITDTYCVFNVCSSSYRYTPNRIIYIIKKRCFLFPFFRLCSLYFFSFVDCKLCAAVCNLIVVVVGWIHKIFVVRRNAHRNQIEVLMFTKMDHFPNLFSQQRQCKWV